jgi:TrmH family RNA methyltransferase
MTLPSQQLIKDVAALARKKQREETGCILVEGRHPIEEAIRAGLIMKYAFIQADYAELALLHNENGDSMQTKSLSENTLAPTHKANSLPKELFPASPYVVDASQMARMASTDSPPPCLAVFEAPKSYLQTQATSILVLDSIQDPGNLGTLLRSALAFGVEAVILAGDCVEAYNPKVIRASAGLVFALPVLSCCIERTAEFFATADWTVYATTGNAGALSYRAANYTGHCAIILGNEGRGVSPALLESLPVQALTVPMTPQVESLNVAISGSIILAEAATQRGLCAPVTTISREH